MDTAWEKEQAIPSTGKGVEAPGHPTHTLCVGSRGRRIVSARAAWATEQVQCPGWAPYQEPISRLKSKR